MELRAVLVVVTLLLASGAARAHLVSTAPLFKVARYATVVAKGRVDLKTGRFRVERTLGGRALPGELDIVNFSSLPRLGRTGGGDRHAWVCLACLDHRYYLVTTANPDWVGVHSAIRFLDDQGRVWGYLPGLLGDSLVLRRDGEWSDRREKKLAGALERHRSKRGARSLTPAEARRFYRLITPHLDLYSREVKTMAPHRLEALVDRLEVLVAKEKGTLRRRAIEALVALAHQLGADQVRRKRVEKRLYSLVDRVGGKPFLPVLDAVIASQDLRSNKETAARILRRLGGEPRERAARLLVALMERSRSTLRSRAYFALVYLGREDLAKATAKRLQARSKIKKGRRGGK